MSFSLRVSRYLTGDTVSSQVDLKQLKYVPQVPHIKVRLMRDRINPGMIWLSQSAQVEMYPRASSLYEILIT